MSGWDLKKGDFKQLFFKREELLENHSRFFSKKSVMKNFYKVILYESILDVSLKKEKEENILDEIVKKFAEKYWNLKRKNKFILTMYNGISEKSKQEIEIAEIISKYCSKMIEPRYEELSDIARKDYINKTKKVLKTNVLGALYNDFKGTLYLFDKKEDLLILNKHYKKLFIENYEELKEINELRKLELLKILNQDNELLRKYFRERKLNLEIDYYKIMKIKLQRIVLEEKNKKKEKPMNSKQGFRLEVNYCVTLLEHISNGATTKQTLKEVTGAGENRIITFTDWLKYIGAVEGTGSYLELTKLGETYLKIKESDDYLEPLMLYHLVRNPELKEKDGHYYFATLINDLFYNIVFDYENTISLEKIKSELLKIGADAKYPNFITSAVTTLMDAQSGFGKMGILERVEKTGKEENVEIHSYWIEPLVGAYIIYDMWKDGQTAMEISNIINEKYNLGRMFLMDADAVKETLLEIQALNLIEVEERSGLDQIRIKKGITKEDILNRIVEEA